ncbi:Hypothetical predicted protein [Podarcis lilfordi]|uniref:Uncharacterized protein n=1 Tax=Podarcis lilfordi TaxID=74358 RepID=A0AA35KL47_9SAUR|nr:Hypothetical predicted protein [Podarcis lilfordi]
MLCMFSSEVGPTVFIGAHSQVSEHRHEQGRPTHEGRCGNCLRWQTHNPAVYIYNPLLPDADLHFYPFFLSREEVAPFCGSPQVPKCLGLALGLKASTFHQFCLIG